MMSRQMMKCFVLCFALSTLVGCATLWAGQESDMYALASATTKLSKSVEATVRYEPPPDGTDEKEILRLATVQDPSLLTPFTDYTLHVNRKAGHAVVLVCDKNDKVALLEDAGCTGKMDKHHWREGEKPCRFILDVEKECQAGNTH